MLSLRRRQGESLIFKLPDGRRIFVTVTKSGSQWIDQWSKNMRAAFIPVEAS